MSSVEVRQPWYLRAQGFCPTTQALVAWYVLLKKDKGRDADPCMHAQSLSHVNSLQPQWTIACQAPLSVGFPRQEYWSGLPFPHLFNSFPALCFKDLYSSAEDFKFVSVLYHRVIASHVWLCKFKLNWKFHSSVGPVTIQVLCKHMWLVILSWTTWVWNTSIIVEGSIELHCAIWGVIKTQTGKV